MQHRLPGHRRNPRVFIALLAWAVAVWLLPPATVSSQTAAETSPTTLFDSVERALRTNPQLQVMFFNREASNFDLKQARRGYLPALDLSVGYGLEQFSDKSTRAPEADPGNSQWDPLGKATLSLSQNIYDGGKTSSQVSIQKAILDSADHQLRATQQVVALNAVNAHWTVLLQRHLVALAVKNESIQRDILTALVEREQAGVSAIGDVAQAKARLARAEAMRSSSQADLSQAIANYTRVIGSPPERLSYAGDPVALPGSLEETLRKAEQSNPELLALQAEVAEADARVAWNRSRYKPRLELQAKSEYSDQSEGDPSWQQTNEAMLVLNMNLFNGGRDHAGVQSALSRKNQSLAKRVAKQAEVTEAVTAAWASYLSLQRQKQANLSALDSSRTTFEAYLTQYSVSRRSLLDVLMVENDYFQSAVQMASAHVQETIAAYRILSLMGTLQVAPPTDTRESLMYEDLFSRSLNFPDVAKLFANTEASHPAAAKMPSTAEPELAPKAPKPTPETSPAPRVVALAAAPDASVAHPNAKPLNNRGCTVKIGPCIAPAEVDRAEERLRSQGAGFQAVRGKGPVKMVRLFRGTYPLEEARRRLAELKLAVESAYLLPEGSVYALYAASFHDAAGARRMAEALRGRGIDVSQVPVEVEMEGKLLIALQPDRQSAEALAQQIAALGLSASLFCGE